MNEQLQSNLQKNGIFFSLLFIRWQRPFAIMSFGACWTNKSPIPWVVSTSLDRTRVPGKRRLNLNLSNDLNKGPECDRRQRTDYATEITLKRFRLKTPHYWNRTQPIVYRKQRGFLIAYI